MRNQIIVVFVFFSLAVIGQTNSKIQLTWNAPEIFQSELESIEVPSFTGASYNFEENVVPVYCSSVKAFSWSMPKVSLQNVVVSSLTSQEIKLINGEKLGNSFEIKAQVTGEKKQPLVVYCVSSIRINKSTGQYEKLISADVQFSAVKEARKTTKTSSFASSSVLSSGQWYKVSINKTGVYKLTPGYLNDIGFGSNISVNNIAVYGNGMGSLPERNDGFRHDDLQENALYVEDENSDGIFNGNDYALFYGEGPKQWTSFIGNNTYEHQNHYYEDRNYYFITISGIHAKRVGNVNYNPSTATHQVSSFDDHQFLNDDKVNVVGSGKRWLGDLFDFKLSYNYSFSFPNLDVNDTIKIKTLAAGRSLSNNTFMQVSQGSNTISTVTFDAVSGSSSGPYFDTSESSDYFFSSSPSITLTVNYNNNANPAATAWLDYIEIVARRNLVYQSGQVFRDIRSVGSGNVAQFNFTSVPSNAMVWDVSNHLNPQLTTLALNGSNASLKAPADSLREFVMVTGSNFPSPAKVGSVQNQNLHALENIDMVIVSHRNFLSEANRLAEYHRQEDNLTVEVVDVQLIYNEFSSGGQDIVAIKDLMRSLHEKALTPEDGPKYLLLFGDASYDYKELDKNIPNDNYVPIFQSSVSSTLYLSYSTDDFYGFLDPTEGVNMQFERLDVGIGRFPVRTVTQARQAVDKVINYKGDTESRNSWRNSLLFVSDDVDEGWETILTEIPEQVTKKLDIDYPMFDIQKIYTDSYIQTSSAGSQRYPEARQELFRRVQSGNLITTYVGHGGEVGWATERILQLEDINAWNNGNTVPLFSTITCEFTRLDDPLRVSAGEQLFLNNDGGAVSLISTTRVVYVGPARNIVVAMFDTIFGKVDGQYQTLGQVVMNTKNQVFQQVRLKFSLFGDPAMRLNIPEYKVVTTKINGTDVSLSTDTLKALSKVIIEGQVEDESGNLLTGYNGVMTPTIFDKRVEKTTLMNDNQGYPIDYSLFQNILYKGKVVVENGKFKYEFIVPLDINYSVANGRFSYYSTNTENTFEAKGYYNDVAVGGLNVNAPADNVGPGITLYLNDPSFVNGGITGNNPVLFAEVVDSSGINTVGNGIGHDLVAILDDDANNVLVLNEYYEADLNSYQSGKINYPMYNLEPGNHKLTVRVWDVYNNPSEHDINFVVTEESGLVLEHVLNWPNPFTTYTEFQFEHNRASQPLDVQVQVFSVSGQLVKTINQQIQSSGNRVTGVSWDGRDEYGDAIAKGVYVYKLRVRSTIDQAYAEKTEKLVILN